MNTGCGRVCFQVGMSGWGRCDEMSGSAACLFLAVPLSDDEMVMA